MNSRFSTRLDDPGFVLFAHTYPFLGWSGTARDTLIVDNLPVELSTSRHVSGKSVSAALQILKQATGVVAARGEGVLLYDEDDRRYLDFTAGIGVTSTGHCHPRVVEAAQSQVGTLIHGQYTTVMHRPLLTLVERLGEVLPRRSGPDVLRQLRQRGRSRRRCG